MANVSERRHYVCAMLIRTPADLGAVIRDRRKQLKLDQATFAKRIGVSRQWVIEIERGHRAPHWASCFAPSMP